MATPDSAFIADAALQPGDTLSGPLGDGFATLLCTGRLATTGRKTVDVWLTPHSLAQQVFGNRHIRLEHLAANGWTWSGASADSPDPAPKKSSKKSSKKRAKVAKK